MQERQHNRELYFRELATTSEKYFMPYINGYKPIQAGQHILEIGCGDGGNLLPFARRGCHVTGVDMAETRIADARRFFREAGTEGTFIASDIFKLTQLEHSFDLILCHDVLEHIDDKRAFLDNLRRYVKPDGLVFMSFPAWQMPFGGHQQTLQNRLVSHLPFIHLLPNILYTKIMRMGGANQRCINGMLDIKRTRCTIELFERLARQTQASILNRELYFINPHYETKFHLKPRRLSPLLGAIPYVRNFFTTSCFYILKMEN